MALFSFPNPFQCLHLSHEPGNCWQHRQSNVRCTEGELEALFSTSTVQYFQRRMLGQAAVCSLLACTAWHVSGCWDYRVNWYTQHRQQFRCLLCQAVRKKVMCCTGIHAYNQQIFELLSHVSHKPLLECSPQQLLDRFRLQIMLLRFEYASAVHMSLHPVNDVLTQPMLVAFGTVVMRLNARRGCVWQLQNCLHWQHRTLSIARTGLLLHAEVPFLTPDGVHFSSLHVSLFSCMTDMSNCREALAMARTQKQLQFGNSCARGWVSRRRRREQPRQS